jgi:cell division protein FtsB
VTAEENTRLHDLVTQYQKEYEKIKDKNENLEQELDNKKEDLTKALAELDKKAPLPKKYYDALLEKTK